MSRVINPDSAGKERTRLSKAIVLAIRELARQQEVTDHSRDLAAFIVLALQVISAGIDVSVAAWEKRDYWVKADRFRMEWAWAGNLGEKLKAALLAEDWGGVAGVATQIAGKLGKVRVSEKHRMEGSSTRAAIDLGRQKEYENNRIFLTHPGPKMLYNLKGWLYFSNRISIRVPYPRMGRRKAKPVTRKGSPALSRNCRV